MTHIGFVPLRFGIRWGICSLGSAALAGLIARFCCFPRVSYRALPSFHPGLCRSAALAGLLYHEILFACTHRNKCVYLRKCLPRTYFSICVYLRKCLPRTYFSICVYLLKRVRRIHFIAVIEEPQRGDTPAKPRAQALG